MRHRVLIVDDDPVLLRVLGRFVESWGAAVDKANNGEEAAALALKHCYSAIIMDVHHSSPLSSRENSPREEEEDGSSEECLKRAAPGREGCAEGPDVTKRIRKNSLDPAPPIIGCTSDTSEATKNECLAAGMVTVIYKPVNSAMIKATLDEVCNKLM